MEMRASRTAVAAGPTRQVAISRNLGTSNARVGAKVEAGRSCKAMSRKAQVLRASMVLVGCNRIRVADSRATATFVAKWAAGQQVARRKVKCKP